MINFIYTENTEELLKAVGIEKELFWQYLSLDDWDYALIFEGHIPQMKLNNEFSRLLDGCYNNEWAYFPKQNKTVGMAYHS
uniref:Uncharacterized protein n=1 Tax=viral metagenome TaxID=1070528 RepID=A0A6M3XTV7_9ZZZZ